MKQLRAILIYSGAIPFLFCMICLIFGINTIPLFGSVIEILSVYSLVIASFLAGSLWGLHLINQKRNEKLNEKLHKKHRLSLQVASNSIAVILWLSYLAFESALFIIITIGCFLALLLIDQKLHQNQIISADYLTSRLKITIIVMVSLSISLFFS